MLSMVDPRSLLPSPGTSLCKPQQCPPDPGEHPGHILTLCLGNGWYTIPSIPPTLLANPTVITVSVSMNKMSCVVSKSRQKAATAAAYQTKRR